MPGPFNTPGLGGALPPLPSPTAGMPTAPNMMAQLGQAIGQFPGQQQNAQESRMQMATQKLDMKKQELGIEELGRKTSLQKLEFFYKRLSSDPTGASSKDPTMLKAVNEAAKEAGVGTMSMRDPMTGAEAIDLKALQHLVSSRMFSELDPKNQEAIRNADPGADRIAQAEALGVDKESLPQGFVDAASPIKEGDRIKLLKMVGDAFKDTLKGGGTPAQAISRLSLMSSELTKAGITPDVIKEYMGSDDYKSGISEMAKAQMDKMRNTGYKDAALASYYKVKTIDEPKMMQGMIDYHNGMLGVAKTNANTRMTQVNNQAQFNRIRLQNQAGEIANRTTLLKDMVFNKKVSLDSKQVDTQVKLVEAQIKIAKSGLDSSIKDGEAYLNNNQSIPDDVMEQQENARNAMQDAQGLLDNIRLTRESNKNTSLTSKSGRPAAFTQENTGIAGGKIVNGQNIKSVTSVKDGSTILKIGDSPAKYPDKKITKLWADGSYEAH